MVPVGADSTAGVVPIFSAGTGCVVPVGATLVFLPIVLAYTGFVFRVLKGAVTAKQIESNSSNLY